MNQLKNITTQLKEVYHLKFKIKIKEFVNLIMFYEDLELNNFNRINLMSYNANALFYIFDLQS